MTNRKKKGIGLLVTGLISMIVGGVMLATNTTPEIIPVAISIVGAIMDALGITFVAPDK